MSDGSTTRIAQQTGEAVDVLRYVLEGTDQARYIFSLLLLRSFSERSDSTVRVPADAKWSMVAGPGPGLPARLNHAFQLLERSNNHFHGLFQDFDFDGVRLGTASEREDIARRVTKLIGEWSFDVVEPGTAADMILHRIGESKQSGQFFTPSSLARLMVALADPRPGMRVVDPVCGTGSLLVGCFDYVRRLSIDGTAPLTLEGQEKQYGIGQLCRMNLLLHGIHDARIEWGDVLREPKLVRNSLLIKYDRVLADLPIGLEGWTGSGFIDPYNRFPVLPPKNNGDYAFILHCLAELDHGGRAVLAAPRGVLFRGGDEAIVRQFLLEHDVFEAIIDLPSIRYETALAPVVLVLSRDKPSVRRNKILVVDAEALGARRGRRQILDPDGESTILTSYLAFHDVPGFARVIDSKDVVRNAGNLSVTLYLPSAESARPSLVQQIGELAAMEAARNEAARNIDALIEALREDLDAK
jgi:type I restriction enzyme M protein